MKKILLFLLTFCIALFSTAATFNVDNSLDAGIGSFRQAIIDANAQTGMDTVVFATSTNGNPIILSSASITIADSVHIVGNGVANTSIDRDGLAIIISINSNVFLDVIGISFSNFTSTAINGSVIGQNGPKYLVVRNCDFLGLSSGNGVYFQNPAGSIEVERCNFSNLQSGANINCTNAIVRNCYVTNCSIVGLFVHASGANYIVSNNTVESSNRGFTLGVESSIASNQISNNTAYNNTTEGIVIKMLAILPAGGLVVSNNTAANNTIGLEVSDEEGNNTNVIIQNCILWNNSTRDFSLKDFSSSGVATNPSFLNNIGTTEQSDFGSVTFFSTVDPLLDPLGTQNNGGPTPTISIAATSLAINNGLASNAPSADQRGFLRNGTLDIGSYEFNGIDCTTMGTDTRTECAPFTWIDGNAYSTNNNTATFNIVGGAASGCDSLVTLDLTIGNINADFTGSNIFGCGPHTVNFTDNTTSLTSPISSWAWNFGDGDTSNVQNPSHTYMQPGSYTVSLTVTNINGCSDTHTKTNYVQIIGPDVNFGADTLQACNSLLVNFTDSTVFGAPLVAWNWNFGDGNSASTPNPSNTYTSSGNFDVSLTVHDIDGCSRTFTRSQYINIYSPAAGTDTRSECGSITWIDGNTYTANNNTATFNIVGGAASGCDSLVTLDLTILQNTTHTVLNSNDSGAGSLRELVSIACPNDTIRFDASTDGNAIILTSGAINITKNLFVIGNDTGLTLLQGGNDIFLIVPSIDVNIQGISFSNYSNAGINRLGWSSTLTLGNLEVSRCDFNGTGSEIGIYFDAANGSLFVDSCSFSDLADGLVIQNSLLVSVRNNYAINCSSTGLGIFVINPLGSVIMTNNTVENCNIGFYSILCSSLEISNNTAYNNSNSGMLFDDSFAGSAPIANISNNTFANNANGLRLFEGGGAPTFTNVTVQNNIFWNNTTLDIEVNEHLSNGGVNPIFTNNIGLTQSSDFGPLTFFSSLDPLLDVTGLQNNGGYTPTISVGAASLAINNGTATNAPLLDQRGFPRVGAIDIGAYESECGISITGTDTRTACDSLTWIDGTTYTASNNTATFNIVGGAANGCDSLVTLDLTINSTVSGTDTQIACDSLTWIDGLTYTSNNNTATFNIVGGAAAGCDSLVTLNLTINNSATSTDTQTACDSLTWIDGNTYTTSNNTATFNIVGAAANGCDSLVTLDLTIKNSAAGTDTQTACDSLTWIDGITYTASNNTAIFNIVGGAASGCDSLVTLDLTINNSATGTDTQIACDSLTWIDGTTYTSSNNTATFNIVGGTANGCDSLVTLDLTIINSATGTDTRSECGPLNWIDGNTYSTSNNTATFNIAGGAVNGCDSLVTLDLTINSSVSGTDTQTACDSLTWIDGTTYTASNNTATFNIVGGAANGCDSLVTLDLTINSTATGIDTQTACDSLTWIDGITYTASNNTAIFNIVGGAANGCDSLVTLDLTINTSATGTDIQTACDSLTWIDGLTYTASNNTTTFNIIGGAANGCDSLVTLDLTINPTATGTDTQTACDSLTWIDGTTYTASNNTATFNIVGGAANGCDSLVTLDLTINNSTTGIDTQTACDSLTWIDGNTYTSSNNTATFNLVGGAANGCDSLVTLDLTISNSTTGTDTQTACNAFTWIDGNTYTSSNNTATFNIVGGTANGCDSLVTLDLTINNSATGIDTQTACNTFTWIDGVTYIASNNTATFNIVGGAANGCDSLVTLDLNINFNETSSSTITACDSYTWVDGNTYTSDVVNQNFVVPGAATNGCDSVYTLNLNILSSMTDTQVVVVCDSFTWIDGNIYGVSNNTASYTEIGGATNGCDLTTFLDLTVLPQVVVNIVNNNGVLEAPAGFNSYTWIRNGEVQTGSTNTFTPTAYGGYICIVDNGDCITTSNMIVIGVNTAIKGQAFSEISIYPNPAKDFLHIDVGSEQLSSIRLLDLNGSLVKELDPNQQDFDMSPYASGLYFIQLLNDKQQSIVKVVLE